jgi:prepilin-type processing-associated H-X9-DG protein
MRWIIKQPGKPESGLLYNIERFLPDSRGCYLASLPDLLNALFVDGNVSVIGAKQWHYFYRPGKGERAALDFLTGRFKGYRVLLKFNGERREFQRLTVVDLIRERDGRIG